MRLNSSPFIDPDALLTEFERLVRENGDGDSARLAAIALLKDLNAHARAQAEAQLIKDRSGRLCAASLVGVPGWAHPNPFRIYHQAYLPGGKPF